MNYFCIKAKCRIFIFFVLISEAVFSASPSNPEAADADADANANANRIISIANPAYYCFKEDMGDDKDELRVIGKYGYVDINLLESTVTRRADELSLHPKISSLFFDKLVPYFNANPYVGSRTSRVDRPSAGWFGGISMVTLIALDYIMAKQHILPPDQQKMKFLGVGSGNAFFEFLLSHIGHTSAMDVIHTGADSISLEDRANLHAMQARPGSFFMPVTVHESHGAADDARIVAATFSDENYKDTVLVLSWPRDFAIPYIHKFLEKGGRAVLFVRNEAVDSIFDRTHLGEIRDDLPNFKFKQYLSTFGNCSLPLNTATFSTVDLYWKGKQKPPIVVAIERVKKVLGK